MASSRSSSFSWQGNSYKVAVRRPATDDDDGDEDEERFFVGAELFDINQVKIGRLTAYLLPRPLPYFFEFADEISSEMVSLAMIFCDANGVANRVENHPKMTLQAVRGGGFLNIDIVEIDPLHQKKDLGLRFLHHFLLELKGEWTLAVMIPCALGNHWCTWKENDRQGAQLTNENLDQNVARQFARMGFAQAGPKMDQLKAWFLSASAYLSTPNPVDTWLTKEQAARIQIREVPQKVVPTGLDNELKEAVLNFPDADSPRKAAALQNIQNLVRRGASVNNSGSLQAAAANLKDPSVVTTLVRTGGNVNHQDVLGNTALHVAATFMRHETLVSLINLGADKSLRNHDNETPLDCLENAGKMNDDFMSCFGLTAMLVRDIDCAPKLGCINALISPTQRSLLVDGWLSPRMKYALETTAGLVMDHILNECEVGFEKFQPTPLSTCCGGCGINRIYYIPATVLKNNPDGLYASFNAGWGYCFLATCRLLQRGQVPTVRRVEEYLATAYDPSVDSRKFQHFKSKGGKVEFAIDAIINITRNVVVDGDDGWEYDTFEEEFEALPATPLDRAFDIVRFKCINEGGGEGKYRGPYRETIDIGLGESFDEVDY